MHGPAAPGISRVRLGRQRRGADQPGPAQLPARLLAGPCSTSPASRASLSCSGSPPGDRQVANGAVSGRIVEIVGGVAVILFGLAIIGVVRIGLLERTTGFRFPRPPQRGVFGASWSASSSGSDGRPASAPTWPLPSPSPPSVPTRSPAPCSWWSTRSGSACPSSPWRCSGRHSPDFPAAFNRFVGPSPWRAASSRLRWACCCHRRLHAPHLVPRAALDAESDAHRATLLRGWEGDGLWGHGVGTHFGSAPRSRRGGSLG